MVTKDQITVAGTNYLAHKENAEQANNKKSKHAELMVAAINRSTLGDYRAILRTDLHNADTKAQLVAEDITIQEWKEKSGVAYARYDAYNQEIQKCIELIELIETYLEGRRPEKSNREEYIKVAHHGGMFWCQRFTMTDSPSADDKNTSGCAKYDAPSKSRLVAMLRAAGKLQPIYEVYGNRFHKIG
jgi:hypothetical protein